MKPRSVAAARGWEWVVCGWKLFARNPAVWIIMIILYGLTSLVVQALPVIGTALSAMLSPVLTGGMLYAARELDEGREADFTHLFQAFRVRSLLVPLLLLGAITLPLVLAMNAAFDSMLMEMQALGEGADAQQVAAAAETATPNMLLVTVLAVVLIAALFYSVPLVMLSSVEPLAALRNSFVACFMNILPLLIYSLILTVAGIIATIPFMLGWLVLLPMTFTTVYCSYRDIFAPPPVETDETGVYM